MYVCPLIIGEGVEGNCPLLHLRGFTTEQCPLYQTFTVLTPLFGSPTEDREGR